MPSSAGLFSILLLSACSSEPSATDRGVSPGETRTCPNAPRDPALWPFESSDPWNTPLGSGATYAMPSSPVFDRGKGGVLNCATWSHPVYIAQSSDPMRTFLRSDGSVCAQARVPAGAEPDPEADAHLHVIDETHSSVVETWLCTRQGDDYSAEACVINDLRGPGVFSTWHGVRAYGGSALGGLIRKGELKTEIPHALAASVEPSSLNKNTPNSKAFVWPASAADAGAQSSYGSSGNLHMGSLLAIPPSVNLTTLGLTGAAIEIGRAMQDYGVYIADIGGANLAIYAEPAAQAEVVGLAQEIRNLTALLEVVTNNTVATPGGGGTPRRCPAPPFIP